MQRNKDLWGPDGAYNELSSKITFSDKLHIALEFDPERFIDERLHKYLTTNPFIFLPFNAGARTLFRPSCSVTKFPPALLRSPPLPWAAICL